MGRYKGSLYGTGTGSAQRVSQDEASRTDGEAIVNVATTMAHSKAASGIISKEEAAHIAAVNERLRMEEADDDSSDSGGELPGYRANGGGGGGGGGDDGGGAW